MLHKKPSSRCGLCVSATSSHSPLSTFVVLSPWIEDAIADANIMPVHHAIKEIGNASSGIEANAEEKQEKWGKPGEGTTDNVGSFESVRGLDIYRLPGYMTGDAGFCPVHG